jgi:hypothetical protein
MVTAILYGQREFDCELFIPDLDELVMVGNSVMQWRIQKRGKGGAK